MAQETGATHTLRLAMLRRRALSHEAAWPSCYCIYIVTIRSLCGIMHAPYRAPMVTGVQTTRPRCMIAAEASEQ